ncbi:MAG: hypothetical protein U0M12_02365 [Acutalibacteraceae bacterium]|nr:hypothetical protein [Acutalibacteraceae bacterium]
MKYRVKEHKIYTSNSDKVRSMTHNGFRLQSVAYFVNGNGIQSYVLIKNSL